MSAQLAVDPAAFAAAARRVERALVREPARALASLTGALAASGSPAGRDAPARAWTELHNAAGRLAIRAATGLLVCGRDTGDRLVRTWHAHRRADLAVRGRTTVLGMPGTGSPGWVAGDRPAGPCLHCGTPGSTPHPAGWAPVAELGALPWPDGSPCGLRALARAWDDAARAWSAAADACADPSRLIAAQNTPEAPAIAAVLAATEARLRTLSRVQQALGRCCAELAERLQVTQAAITALLREQHLGAGGTRCAEVPGRRFDRVAGPGELPPGWRVAAAAQLVTPVLREHAAAVQRSSWALPLAADLCAGLVRLAEQPAQHGIVPGAGFALPGR